jgi:competence protein ComEC
MLWAVELALIATVAELVMVLPMAVYFHRVTVFSLPANLVVIPLIGILAPVSVATFLASLASPWLALPPAAITAGLLHGITWAIHRISHLAVADVRVPAPAGWIGLIAVALWLSCCWAVRRARWGAIATAAALPLLAALVLWPERPLATPGTLEITAIDVGQGDSLLAVNPDGRAMLIDAGGPVGRNGSSEVVANFDVGEEVVSPYLWSRRLRRLDVVVLSHAHTDHMGGMPAILENFRPRELWVGSDPHSELYAKLLDDAARLGIVVRHLHAGDREAWGDVAISVLAPVSGYSNPGAPKNDDSLVLALRYGKASALLEGDAETPSELAMLAAGLVHPVTLLKVGHHGSATSTTQAFLDAAAPTDAVVSFGLTTFLLTPDGNIREFVHETALPAHK